MTPLTLFLYLQILDILTTVCGLKLGADEINPIAHSLMSQFGIWRGIAIIKGFSVASALFMVYYLKAQVPNFINRVFAGVVVWNLLGLLVLIFMKGKV